MSLVASFSFSQLYNTVQFTDTSTESPNEWYWDFGDGNHSYEQNPIHTYHSVDTFTVILYASNQYQYDNKSDEIDITQIMVSPSAFFTPNKAVVVHPTLPITIPFTNLSIPDFGCTYEWDFGNSTESTDKNPSATYSALGKYDVSLTVTNALGSDTKTYECGVWLINCHLKTVKEIISVSDTSHGFNFSIINELVEIVDNSIALSIVKEIVRIINGDDPKTYGRDEYGIGHGRKRLDEYGNYIVRNLKHYGQRIVKAITYRTDTECKRIEHVAVCNETVYVSCSAEESEP